MKKKHNKTKWYAQNTFVYITSTQPFILENAFREKKSASQKLRENTCSVFIMVIVISDYQGFLGEIFKIITYYRIDRFVKLN